MITSIKGITIMVRTIIKEIDKCDIARIFHTMSWTTKATIKAMIRPLADTKM